MKASDERIDLATINLGKKLNAIVDMQCKILDTNPGANLYLYDIDLKEFRKKLGKRVVNNLTLTIKGRPIIGVSRI